MHQDRSPDKSVTGSGICWQHLGPWLALLCLLWLFAPHITSSYDSQANHTVSELQIGVGAASWVSVTYQVGGLQHWTEWWESIAVDWHPTPVTAMPLVMLVLLLTIRWRVTASSMNAGLAAGRKAVMRHYRGVGSVLVKSALAGLIAMLVFGFLLPQQQRTVIEGTTTAELETLKNGIERQLGRNEFGYQLHLRKTEDQSTELVIWRYRSLFDFKPAFKPLEELEVMSGRQLYRFELQAHAAAVPLAAGVGLFALLLGLRPSKLRASGPCG